MLKGISVFASHYISEEDALKFACGIFSPLTALLSNAKVSSYGRDNIMELLIKYVTKRDGLNWSRHIIDEGGETWCSLMLFCCTLAKLTVFCVKSAPQRPTTRKCS